MTAEKSTHVVEENKRLREKIKRYRKCSGRKMREGEINCEERK